MSHTIIFKTDYGHIIDVDVSEYDELTGLSSIADLSLYTTKQIIIKKPGGIPVYLDAQIPSGVGLENHLEAIIPSGLLSDNGYYIGTILVANELQQFHSTEFGFNVTTPKEQ